MMQRIALMAIAALASCGCASIVHTATVGVPVRTDPPGATAIAGSQRVTTPGTLDLPRGEKDVEVRIEKEGYRPITVHLVRSMGGAVWTNFVALPAGVIIGVAAGKHTLDNIGTNVATGAFVGLAVTGVAIGVDIHDKRAYEFDPEEIIVKLTPER